MDTTLELYKNGKTVNEICEIRKLTKQVIENHIIYIFENYDEVDIDPDYFGLTQEYEIEIKNAIKKIGSDKLNPIKNIVNSKITYAQIKLCILLFKNEGK